LGEEVMTMAPKKPTLKEVSEAARKLRNPRTPEKKESEYARTLRAAPRKKKK
jgi:hypothetical protein